MIADMEIEKYLQSLSSQVEEESQKLFADHVNSMRSRGRGLVEKISETKEKLKEIFYEEKKFGQEFSKIGELFDRLKSVGKSDELTRWKKLYVGEKTQKEENFRDLENLGQKYVELEKKQETAHHVSKEEKEELAEIINQKIEIIYAKDEIIKKLKERNGVCQEQMSEQIEKYQRIVKAKEKDITRKEHEKVMKDQEIFKAKFENESYAKDLRNLSELIKIKDQLIMQLKNDQATLKVKLRSESEKNNQLKANFFSELNNKLKESNQQLKKMREKEREERNMETSAVLEKEKLISDKVKEIEQLSAKTKLLEEEVTKYKIMEDNKTDIINKLTLRNEVNEKRLSHLTTIGNQEEKKEDRESEGKNQLTTLVQEIKQLTISLNASRENTTTKNTNSISQIFEKDRELDELRTKEKALREELMMMKQFLLKKDTLISNIKMKFEKVSAEGKAGLVDKKIISILQSKLKVSQRYLLKLNKERNTLKMERENIKLILKKQMDQLDLYSLQIKEQDETLEQMKELFERKSAENRNMKRKLKLIGKYSQQMAMLNSKNEKLVMENRNLKSIIKKQTVIIKSVVKQPTNSNSNLFYE